MHSLQTNSEALSFAMKSQQHTHKHIDTQTQRHTDTQTNKKRTETEQKEKYALAVSHFFLVVSEIAAVFDSLKEVGSQSA